MKLTYDNPQTAVFLRTLAWELYVAKASLRVQDVVMNQVQEARVELGLSLFNDKSGGAHDFIQKTLRRHNPPLLSAGHTLPTPTEKEWKTEWRLLFLPPHSRVRMLSRKPVCETKQTKSAFHEFSLTLRNPAVPRLSVYVGAGAPPLRGSNRNGN